MDKYLNREILLSFWKAHVLHHAAEGPVVGQWMLNELRRHGYEVSPGTLYPPLRRCILRPQGFAVATGTTFATTHVQ